MEYLYHFIRDNTDSLYTIVYSSNLFFIDYWSAIHFCTGILLMAITRSLFCSNRWAILLGILFAYELLEIAFMYISIDIFLPETIPDQVTDIIVGLLGALLVDSAALVRLHIRSWQITG